MRARKLATAAELAKIRKAIELMREARELARSARVSERSINRIRSAIKSLGGAERHAIGSLVSQEIDRREESA